MSDSRPLAPLLDAIDAVARWLEGVHAPGVLIGGIAASLLGRPRVTRDVDVLVLVDESEWQNFLTAGRAYGFQPRRPDAVDFARTSRVLLVRHEPSGIDVDIVFGALRFEEEAVHRSVWVDVGGVRAPLPSPEDLIIMKAVAHRPRDLIDIAAILETHPEVDKTRIRQWVREFADTLATPDLYDELERLLATKKGSTR